MKDLIFIFITIVNTGNGIMNKFSKTNFRNINYIVCDRYVEIYWIITLNLFTKHYFRAINKCYDTTISIYLI